MTKRYAQLQGLIEAYTRAVNDLHHKLRMDHEAFFPLFILQSENLKATLAADIEALYAPAIDTLRDIVATEVTQ